jgi:hypothetical protein
LGVKLTPYNSSKVVEFSIDFFAGFDAAHYGINVNHAKSKFHIVFLSIDNSIHPSGLNGSRIRIVLIFDFNHG